VSGRSLEVLSLLCLVYGRVVVVIWSTVVVTPLSVSPPSSSSEAQAVRDNERARTELTKIIVFFLFRISILLESRDIWPEGAYYLVEKPLKPQPS
jgi:hypothetical protein